MTDKEKKETSSTTLPYPTCAIAQLNADLMYKLISETLDSLNTVESYISHQDSMIDKYGEVIEELYELKGSLNNIIKIDGWILRGFILAILIIFMAIIMKYSGISPENVKQALEILLKGS